MVKQILKKPGSGIMWASVKSILVTFPEARYVAIGNDLESGNDSLLLEGASTVQPCGFAVWDYETLLSMDISTWISWLSLHLFVDAPVLVPCVHEDSDLFEVVTYRQNSHALAEIYVWDAAEALVISESRRDAPNEWVQIV